MAKITLEKLRHSYCPTRRGQRTTPSRKSMSTGKMAEPMRCLAHLAAASLRCLNIISGLLIPVGGLCQI